MKIRLVFMAFVVLGYLNGGCSRNDQKSNAIVVDGLVHIVFNIDGDKIITNTHASAYQRWSVTSVNDRFKCFTSSDIGSCAYILQSDNTILQRPAICLRKDDYILYFLYFIEETDSASVYGKISNGIEMIVAKKEGGQCDREMITGRYRYAEDTISLLEDGLLCVTGVDSNKTIRIFARTDK